MMTSGYLVIKYIALKNNMKRGSRISRQTKMNIKKYLSLIKFLSLVRKKYQQFFQFPYQAKFKNQTRKE